MQRNGEVRRRLIYRDFFVQQLALLVLVADQLTKFLVREFLPLRESFPAEGFFRITHTYNTGSAFGLFQGHNSPLIIASLAGVAVLLLIYHSQRRPTTLLRLSLGLQLGGAIGNLLDRVLRGRVTDFMDVGAWPVFNVADASIVTGLVLLGWIFLKGGPGEARETEAQSVLNTDGGTNGDANGLAGSPGLPLRYAWCPVCEGEMRAAGRGWRCSTCGVLERIEDGRV